MRDGVERIRDKNSLTEQLKKKRKSNYDIDHIVIPYSMAATTRVETIKYKEIQTPSWKEVELTVPLPKAVKEGDPEKELEKEQKDQKEQEKQGEVEEEEESTSDLMYKLMHAKAEEEERARWATPLGRSEHRDTCTSASMNTCTPAHLNA